MHGGCPLGRPFVLFGTLGAAEGVAGERARWGARGFRFHFRGFVVGFGVLWAGVVVLVRGWQALDGVERGLLRWDMLVGFAWCWALRGWRGARGRCGVDRRW